MPRELLPWLQEALDNVFNA